MTDQQVIDLYNEMVAHFNGNVPDIDHEPIRFAYYVKLFKRMKAASEQNV